MRYSDLNIETYRHMPAHARTEGEALLIRAGYIRHEGGLTALGQRMTARIEELAQEHPAERVFGLLRLITLATADGDYYFAIDEGHSDVIFCASCGYAAVQPMASFRRPEPTAEPARPMEKVLTPECHTIEALAGFLGVPQDATAKALMYTRKGDNKLMFVVVRGDTQLSEAKLQKLVGEVRLATNEEIVAAGAVPGYASPIGLEQALVVVDELAAQSPNLVAGANEASYHIKNTNCGRDYQAEIVADLALAGPGMPCANCGTPLTLVHASRLADAKGYYLEAILQAVAQTHHNEKGLTLPSAAAPFPVYLLHLPGKELDTLRKARQLHDDWEAGGIGVLFDDRNERAGVKFTDADLIGLPVRATVGERGMKDGMVELKSRLSGESKLVPYAEALDTIQSWTQATL